MTEPVIVQGYRMLIDYDVIVAEMRKVPRETRAVVLRSLCESIARMSGLPTATEDETRAALDAMHEIAERESRAPTGALDEVIMMQRNFEALAWLRLEDATEPDAQEAVQWVLPPDHTSAAAVLQAQAEAHARSAGVVTDAPSALVDAAQLAAWGIRSA